MQKNIIRIVVISLFSILMWGCTKRHDSVMTIPGVNWVYKHPNINNFKEDDYFFCFQIASGQGKSKIEAMAHALTIARKNARLSFARNIVPCPINSKCFFPEILETAHHDHPSLELISTFLFPVDIRIGFNEKGGCYYSAAISKEILHSKLKFIEELIEKEKLE